MERHFTVSGFVSRDGRTALHWHRLGLWLPAGGHIEPDEDPIEAVLREVREETGLDVEVLPTGSAVALPALPRQLPPPVTIGVYDIADVTPHQHIDFVYFTRPLGTGTAELPDDELGWRWVSEAELAAAAPLPRPDGTGTTVVPDDVRRLGLAAIAAARAAPLLSRAPAAGAR
ncbi:MAG: NUDIX domain-containing protein [Dehalococcoidia bacterium]|nr:NUDIX domain-containing protein [Dehalococcoidia bacterium]